MGEINFERSRHVQQEVEKFLGPLPMDLYSLAAGIAYAIELALAWSDERENILLMCDDCRAVLTFWATSVPRVPCPACGSTTDMRRMKRVDR